MHYVSFSTSTPNSLNNNRHSPRPRWNVEGAKRNSIGYTNTIELLIKPEEHPRARQRRVRADRGRTSCQRRVEIRRLRKRVLILAERSKEGIHHTGAKV